MSNLIPEVRVNKNGIPVTKHVKRSNEGRSQAALTAATVKSSYSYDLRKQIEEHVYNAHERGLSGYSSLRSLTQIMPWRNTLSDATLEAYLEAIHSRPEDGFADLLLGVFNGYHKDWEASAYLEISKLDPQQNLTGSSDKDKYGRGDKAYRRACSVYRGLGHYDAFSYEVPLDMLDKNDPMVTKTLGIVRLTHRICNESESIGMESMFVDNPADALRWDHVVRLEPQSLAALAADRPDDADRIADVVVEREITDTDAIVNILDADVSHLSSGVL
jgi:hypothetical protein